MGQQTLFFQYLDFKVYQMTLKGEDFGENSAAVAHTLQVIYSLFMVIMLSSFIHSGLYGQGK